MNNLLVSIYFVLFALVTGSAFALMWGNIKSINDEMAKPYRRRHPEAPKAGEEVMYVNLDREKLENSYNISKNKTLS